MESKDPSEVSKLISKMRTPIDTLRSQLEFAVEYERIGTVPLTWIGVDEAVSEAQSALAGDFLEVNCDVRDIEVYVDPMFSKVFQNLLINTIKHGGRAKHVKIETDEREEGLTIIYSDDGLGVPSEEKEKIFEPGVGQNIGLGLYIVRQLLQTCSMTIKETGEHGTGARFEILVPAKSYRVKSGRH
jgi:signal transduction histidine kinase